MRRYDPYSRRVLRRRRNAWLGTNRKIVAGVALGCVALLGLVTAMLVIAVPAPFRWYVLGALHAGVIAACLHLLQSAFLANDAQAIWHVRGAWGEENTRSELKRARTRRLIWDWVDSINLQAGDLDHVVVTRRGGLVAIDSKWRSQVTAEGVAEMARDALRTKSRAEGVARTLLESERGSRHRARVKPLPVTPVVVVWGAAQHTMPDEVRVHDGVHFVAGRRLLSWLRSLEGDTVSKDAARDLIDRLETYRATAWQDA